METFGMIGFTFGLMGFIFGMNAMAKVDKLEKRLDKMSPAVPSDISDATNGED